MKETRNFKIDTNDKELTLTGIAVVYDKPTTITERDGSHFTEVIRKGALDNADISDCRLLYNHDSNSVPLARTPKTMKLKISPAGLEFNATLAEENRKVYTAVKRGDLDGCSFAFTVPEDGDSYDPKTNTRTIHKISKVYELSVVPFPAYQQTSVEARSAIESKKERYQLRNKLKIKINQLLYRGRKL